MPITWTTEPQPRAASISTWKLFAGITPQDCMSNIATRHSGSFNPKVAGRKGKTSSRGTLISSLRKRRDRSILQHPIDVQVDVLVVEAEQVFDLRALGNRRRITPHDVLDDLVADPS